MTHLRSKPFATAAAMLAAMLMTACASSGTPQDGRYQTHSRCWLVMTDPKVGIHSPVGPSLHRLRAALVRVFAVANGHKQAIDVTLNLTHRWRLDSSLIGSQFRIVTADNTQQLIDHDLSLTALDRHTSKLPCDDTASHAFVDAVADTDRRAKLLV
jgi:hypothetical protein